MNVRFHPKQVHLKRVAAPGRSALAVGAMLAVLAGCVQRDMSDLQYFVEETKRPSRSLNHRRKSSLTRHLPIRLKELRIRLLWRRLLSRKSWK